MEQRLFHCTLRAAVQAVCKKQSNLNEGANQGAWITTHKRLVTWSCWLLTSMVTSACLWPESPTRTARPSVWFRNYRGKCAYIHWPQNPPWEPRTVSTESPETTLTDYKATEWSGTIMTTFRNRRPQDEGDQIAQFQTSLSELEIYTYSTVNSEMSEIQAYKNEICRCWFSGLQTPCGLLGRYQRFRGTYCLHFSPVHRLVSTCQSTRRYCPEDQHRHLHRRENLKFRTITKVNIFFTRSSRTLYYVALMSLTPHKFVLSPCSYYWWWETEK
jgi:hypothetical protein